MNEEQKRVWFITGTSKGFGRIWAEAALERGDKVVATARDTRRFVAGAVLACLAWFVTWYPNLSGLPLPTAIVNAYQGFLPTYLYAFQFPVNTDPVVTGLKLLNVQTVALLVALLVTCVVVGYSAWSWRISLAEREAERRDPGSIARSGLPG